MPACTRIDLAARAEASQFHHETLERFYKSYSDLWPISGEVTRTKCSVISLLQKNVLTQYWAHTYKGTSNQVCLKTTPQRQNSKRIYAERLRRRKQHGFVSYKLP